MTNAKPLRRFDIALSFPGEHRTFVEQVAGHLAAAFTQDRVLYDKYHDAEFARVDLDVYLPNLYRTESELIVLFLCPEYAAKRWCGLECRFIRQLIGTPDAKRIMFFSFGSTGDYSEFGILSGDGYIEIGAQTAELIAEKIRKRLNINHGVIPKAPAASIRADIDRIVRYAPSELIGREAETALLNDAWDALGTQRFQRADVADKPPAESQALEANARRPEALRTQALRPRVFTFVAMGGEGKTSLVAKWAAELAAKDWPGCDAAFAWSFYSQGSSEQNAASSDLFLAEALRFFGDEAMANSAQGAFEKGKRLAQLVGQQRALLILDGLEPLQYAPTSPLAGELKDQGVAALLKSLATNNNGLCVVTTRYAIPDLRAFVGNTVREEKLTRLSTAAGVALLQRLGVRGSLRKTIPAENPKWNEYETLVEDVKGHALTLHLLGSYLRDAHAGDIRQRDLINLAEANAEVQGGHAFHVMDAYVRWLEGSESRLQAETARSAEERAAGAQPPKGGTLNNGRRALALLQLLGLFDRPATADCLQALWQAPAIAGLTEPLIGISEAQRNLSLKRLEDAKLLTVNRDAAGKLLSLDAHPLVREYFAARVRSSAFRRQQLGTSGRAASQPQPPEGGTLSEAWREAHKRLYEHLCATTKEGDQPTLEDLQPLYQAVAHGCQAGGPEEARTKVYRDRILRGIEHYTWHKFGAYGSELGAQACFFEQTWTRLAHGITESGQAWLLSETAFCLRALGRLTESLEPQRAGLEMRVKQKGWWNAAQSATNLSEAELTLGYVAGAVGNAEQSVTYADRSGDAFGRSAFRTALADALHQAGHRVEAEAHLREAEQIQADDQSSYPLLYSIGGFRYCDLLLAEAERAAWRIDESERQKDELLATCRTVSQRAAQTLKWAEAQQIVAPIEIAFDNLTLGRAALYTAILEQSKIENSKSNIEQAVSGLHRAGQQNYLPLGLLTRAWLRALTGAHTGPESAQEDLEEAWDIAERGSMKLHLADIHLYRARLFGLRNADGGWRSGVPYPWESPEHDLAEAERLINECGYHRRDEELADAKRAILGTM